MLTCAAIVAASSGSLDDMSFDSFDSFDSLDSMDESFDSQPITKVMVGGLVDYYQLLQVFLSPRKHGATDTDV